LILAKATGVHATAVIQWKDFTETLSQELILAKATGVHATAVLPFYLDGGIYTSLRKL